MPDPYDPDEARAALDELRPSADLWAEAERRAAAGEVVPLTAAADRSSHPRRWLAVAAVALLAVGTVAVTQTDDDDDRNVDTADPSASTAPASSPACGITSQLPIRRGSEPSLPRADGRAPDGVVNGRYDADGVELSFEIAVPADDTVVIDPSTQSTIVLGRGEAALASSPSISRVTWAPDGARPCDTFSLTAAGPPGAALDEALATIADGLILSGPVSDDSVTVFDNEACRFGLRGEPPLHVRYPSSSAIALDLNDAQGADVSVPGEVVTDLVGERVEEVQLQRGTAQMWLTDEFVQLRWFPGSQDACESFTATVRGGDQDENRHAAVDLAERVVLPRELDDAPAADPEPDLGPELQPGAYAIWPSASVDSIDGASDVYVGSAEEAAVAFVRQVLGWEDATSLGGEPSHDGRGVGDLFVQSLSRRAEVTVGVAAEAGGHVVYRVGTGPTTARLSAVGPIGRVDVTDPPEGTIASAVEFNYAGRRARGLAGEDVVLEGREDADGRSVPGAVLVTFRDQAGEIIGAWGRALPPGDVTTD